MKRLALLLLLLFSASAYAFESDEQGDWLNNYAGDIDGKYKIGMTLIYRGSDVQGVYFYNDDFQDIRLSGKICDRTRIRLEGYDDQGTVTAVFDGRFKEQDEGSVGSSSEVNRGIIDGTYMKTTDQERHPFHLGMSSASYRYKGDGRYAVAGAADDSIIERSAQTFWRGVQADDKAAVAQCISYPIQVNLDGNRRKIEDRVTFIKNYDRIFTDSLKQTVRASVPHNMFVKYSGIMLCDRGEVWFGLNGKVIAIFN